MKSRWEPTIQRSEGTWIVRRDGKGARKVLDDFPRLAWGPNGDYLFGLRERQVMRVDVRSLRGQSIASWGWVSSRTCVTSSASA